MLASSGGALLVIEGLLNQEAFLPKACTKGHDFSEKYPVGSSKHLAYWSWGVYQGTRLGGLWFKGEVIAFRIHSPPSTSKLIEDHLQQLGPQHDTP